MYQDDCRLKGVVNLVLRDKDGKVKQHKTNRNKVTRAGIAHIIGRMIDDGQDRAGEHKMPRMMSHMAVGIGAAARKKPNQYNAQDFDALPTNARGQTDTTTGQTATSRKRAATPESYDRMLQDERGFRVQLMKDTTLAGEYPTLEGVTLTRGVDGNGTDVPIYNESGGVTTLRFQTGSDGGNTVKRLRTGLKVKKVGANTVATNVTITKIESGVPHATLTTLTLSGSLGAQAPANNAASATIDVDYVAQIPLTSYSVVANMPNHPTHTHVKSQFEPNGDQLGPFGAANNASRPKLDGTTNTEALNSTTGFASGSGPYTEAGIGLLGISRGQIGAFYEREIEHNIDLIFTDQNGLALAAGSNFAGATNVNTFVDEVGYAVLDTISGTLRPRFPFIGAEEDKPAGQTATNAPTSAGDHTSFGSIATDTRGTEFVQFGTAVDGIFQGALVGSSIVADGKSTKPEGYPEGENDYATVGGLTVTNAGAGDQHARYNTATGNDFVAYNIPGQTYAPNAVAGNKKNGDRIVYVATFKENNPRPENDYEVIHKTNANTSRAPFNRVYPITEAGIFNKHIKDLGIFDVGSRPYTTNNTDANVAELAHIDTRAGIGAPTTNVANSELLHVDPSGGGANAVTGSTTFGPVDGVLTAGAKSIQAAAYGFTQGPLTQTMLCRTTFDPVNKATADTLQITWSVQLQDNTAAGS